VTLSAFYPVLDTATLSARGVSIEETTRAVIAAGATIVQFRHKHFFSRDVFNHAQQVASVCREAGALFVINDRADIARLLDAGLHLGQTDLPPAEARRILGPDLVIGFSTHNAEQLRAAAGEPVDYVALGPIFATRSKENPDPVVGLDNQRARRAVPVVGLDNLRAWRSLTTRPLVAIGGITRTTSDSVLAAGADSVAIISDLTSWL
jgi:thiamine-phosphate pyrophosphorylase